MEKQPDESDVWSSDDASAYDSDDYDFVEDALAPAGLYLPDGTPRAVIVPPDDVEDEYDLGLPDDFELTITPEMIRASIEKRQRKREGMERTRMSREDKKLESKNSARESKKLESKNSARESKNPEEKIDVYTRPSKRMRKLRLRF